MYMDYRTGPYDTEYMEHKNKITAATRNFKYFFILLF